MDWSSFNEEIAVLEYWYSHYRHNMSFEEFCEALGSYEQLLTLAKLT
jgi:hypothetical protein